MNRFLQLLQRGMALLEQLTPPEATGAAGDTGTGSTGSTGTAGATDSAATAQSAQPSTIIVGLENRKHTQSVSSSTVITRSAPATATAAAAAVAAGTASTAATVTAGSVGARSEVHTAITGSAAAAKVAALKQSYAATHTTNTVASTTVGGITQQSSAHTTIISTPSPSLTSGFITAQEMAAIQAQLEQQRRAQEAAAAEVAAPMSETTAATADVAEAATESVEQPVEQPIAVTGVKVELGEKPAEEQAATEAAASLATTTITQETATPLPLEESLRTAAQNTESDVTGTNATVVDTVADSAATATAAVTTAATTAITPELMSFDDEVNLVAQALLAYVGSSLVLACVPATKEEYSDKVANHSLGILSFYQLSPSFIELICERLAALQEKAKAKDGGAAAAAAAAAAAGGAPSLAAVPALTQECYGLKHMRLMIPKKVVPELDSSKSWISTKNSAAIRNMKRSTIFVVTATNSGENEDTMGNVLKLSGDDIKQGLSKYWYDFICDLAAAPYAATAASVEAQYLSQLALQVQQILGGSEIERKCAQQVITVLSSSNSLALDINHILSFVARVLVHLKSGVMMRTALGKALPAINFPADSNIFQGKTFATGNKGPYSTALERMAKQRGPLLSRYDSTNKPLKREVLQANYDYLCSLDSNGMPLDSSAAVAADSSERVQPLLSSKECALFEGYLEHFTDGAEGYAKAYGQLCEVEWEGKLERFFVGSAKAKKDKLSVRTLALINKKQSAASEDLSETDLDIVALSDKKRDHITSDERALMYDFMQRYRNLLEQDSKIYGEWEALIFTNNVECTDFLAGLTQVMLGLLGSTGASTQDTNDANVHVLKSVTIAVKYSRGKWLDERNYEAMCFFSTHYSALLKELEQALPGRFKVENEAFKSRVFNGETEPNPILNFPLFYSFNHKHGLGRTSIFVSDADAAAAAQAQAAGTGAGAGTTAASAAAAISSRRRTAAAKSSGVKKCTRVSKDSFTIDFHITPTYSDRPEKKSNDTIRLKWIMSPDAVGLKFYSDALALVNSDAMQLGCFTRDPFSKQGTIQKVNLQDSSTLLKVGKYGSGSFFIKDPVPENNLSLVLRDFIARLKDEVNTDSSQSAVSAAQADAEEASSVLQSSWNYSTAYRKLKLTARKLDQLYNKVLASLVMCSFNYDMVMELNTTFASLQQQMMDNPFLDYYYEDFANTLRRLHDIGIARNYDDVFDPDHECAIVTPFNIESLSAFARKLERVKRLIIAIFTQQLYVNDRDLLLRALDEELSYPCAPELISRLGDNPRNNCFLSISQSVNGYTLYEPLHVTGTANADGAGAGAAVAIAAGAGVGGGGAGAGSATGARTGSTGTAFLGLTQFGSRTARTTKGRGGGKKIAASLSADEAVKHTEQTYTVAVADFLEHYIQARPYLKEQCNVLIYNCGAIELPLAIYRALLNLGVKYRTLADTKLTLFVMNTSMVDSKEIYRLFEAERYATLDSLSLDESFTRRVSVVVLNEGNKEFGPWLNREHLHLSPEMVTPDLMAFGANAGAGLGGLGGLGSLGSRRVSNAALGTDASTDSNQRLFDVCLLFHVFNPWVNTNFAQCLLPVQEEHDNYLPQAISLHDPDHSDHDSSALYLAFPAPYRSKVLYLHSLYFMTTYDLEVYNSQKDKIAKLLTDSATTADTNKPKMVLTPVYEKSLKLSSFGVRDLITTVHRHADVVACFDDLLSKQQLQQAGIKVVHYKKLNTNLLSLLVSTASSDVRVQYYLSSLLSSLDLGLTEEEQEHYLDKLKEDAIAISGSVLMRAESRAIYASELLGLVLSKFVLQAQLRALLQQQQQQQQQQQASDNSSYEAYFMLDDYAALFNSKRTLISDILALQVVKQDKGRYLLRLIVLETKCLSASGEDIAKSLKQTKETTQLFYGAFSHNGSVATLDRKLYLAHLANMMSESNNSDADAIAAPNAGVGAGGRGGLGRSGGGGLGRGRRNYQQGQSQRQNIIAMQQALRAGDVDVAIYGCSLIFVHGRDEINLFSNSQEGIVSKIITERQSDGKDLRLLQMVVKRAAMKQLMHCYHPDHASDPLGVITTYTNDLEDYFKHEDKLHLSTPQLFTSAAAAVKADGAAPASAASAPAAPKTTAPAPAAPAPVAPAASTKPVAPKAVPKVTVLAPVATPKQAQVSTVVVGTQAPKAKAQAASTTAAVTPAATAAPVAKPEVDQGPHTVISVTTIKPQPKVAPAPQKAAQTTPQAVAATASAPVVKPKKSVSAQAEVLDLSAFWMQHPNVDNLVETLVPLYQEEVSEREKWLELIVSRLGSAYRDLGLHTQVRRYQLTSQGAVVEFVGNAAFQASQVRRENENLLTTYGLRVTQVESKVGCIAVHLSDEHLRHNVPYLTLLKERSFDYGTGTGIGAGIGAGSSAGAGSAVDDIHAFNSNFVLGRDDDTGAILYLNQRRAEPHTLIAGATGSGKSTLLKTLLLDMVLTNSPEALQLILADPKSGVELGGFAALPHVQQGNLLTSPDGALEALEELAQETERRYSLFASFNEELRHGRVQGATAETKDLDGYNALMRSQGKPILPRVYLIMDEFADWFLDKDYRKVACGHIIRLSAKARAAGIHLILATQRPDRDAIDPKIKANLGNRLVLRMVDRVNSSIVLDSAYDASTLAGRGHMYCRIGDKCVLAQAAFLSEDEISALLQAIVADYQSRA